MSFMVNIAVIGDNESTKGFAAVGLQIHPCETADQAQAALKRLVSEGCGIIYITEEYAQALSKEISALDEALLPAVIPIPGVKGNTGIGVARLKNSVEKAVGSDIIFNK